MGWNNPGQRQTIQTTPPVSIQMPIAEKIATAIVDRVNAEIIRPGPKPEERECYVVAQELRNLTPQLAELVAKILEVEAIAARKVGG